MLTKSIALVFSCCLPHATAFIPAAAGATTACTQDTHVPRSASAVLPLFQQQQQEQSGVARTDPVPDGSLVLIEVTRKNAKVFKSVAKGSVAEIIEPVDEWRVHETSNREKRSQGQGKHHSEKADPVAEESYLVNFYMKELAEVIDGADSVLLVGHGNAKSNIAEVLATALCERHPSLTDKIEDVLRVDGKHITQNQLLKLGRRHLLHEEDPRRAT
eukprot:g10595.t1